MDDLISKKAAIDALKKDMASLDQIIKGMSAFDVRLDAYVSQRNQVDYDIDTIKQLQPIQPEPAQWVQMLINPRMYRCSNCNIAWNKRLVFDLDNGNEMVMKYCPCCGKKMLAEVDYE